jgi:AraC-like DNA-binding protein
VDERERRMAQNEALFREVNERIKETADGLGSDSAFEYFCECANADCTFQITLTAAQYESVRADPTQFAVLPLHFTPEVETLVSEKGDFWIVRKTGQAGEYVEKLDPRSR